MEISKFFSFLSKKRAVEPKDQSSDAGVDNLVAVEEEKKSESLKIPLSGLTVFTRIADEFKALGLEVSVSFTPDDHPDGFPKYPQKGELQIVSDSKVAKEKYLAVATSVLDIYQKYQGDVSNFLYRKKLHKFAHEAVHKIAEQLAESQDKDISQVYKEKLSDLEYLPCIEDLRKAFKSKVEFTDWAAKNRLYEVFTHEYILELSNYISYRHSELTKDKSSLSILEVGAGNGRLTKFLEKALQDLEKTQQDGSFDVTLVATDDTSWTDTDFGVRVIIGEDVKQMDYKDAVTTYKPDIVLSSWMPSNTDWTQFFREQNVPEYILIGKSDDGVSGTLEDTWNIPGKLDYAYEPDQPYVRYDISGENEFINTPQVSINDSPPFDYDFDSAYSSTVSFRKNS